MTRRYAAPVPGTRHGGSAGSDPTWYALDTLTIKLSYFEQKEDYKLILVNNSMTTQDYKTLGGATSTGDFGSMMREIFEPATQAKFEWDHWGTLRGRRVLAFSYRVAQFRSQWHINYDRKLDIVPAYKGLVYVDKETHQVMRVTLDAEDIPAVLSRPARRHRPRLRFSGDQRPHVSAAAQGHHDHGGERLHDQERRRVSRLSEILGRIRHQVRRHRRSGAVDRR